MYVQPKYNVGDTVFFIKDNAASSQDIDEIRVRLYSKYTSEPKNVVEYIFLTSNNEIDFIRTEHEVAATKAGLYNKIEVV